MSIHAERTVWPSPKVLHWDLRKSFTVPLYQEQWDSRSIIPMNEQGVIKKQYDIYLQFKDSYHSLSFFDYIDYVYHTSCIDFIDFRFDFYKNTLPAPQYRRTSVDFRMKSFDDSRIGAFVRVEEPELVQVNIGTIYSIEDACHTIMANWDMPIGLNFAVNNIHSHSKLPLRILDKTIDVQKESFFQYNYYPNLPKSQSDETIPESIQRAFLFLSTELDRQTFADNLSIMSLMWVIAHEDAHKYSGHLRHFQRMNISEQDQIFNELITAIDDKSYVQTRKAAELEADTCATMRSVDYCFENEFFSIITDWFSPDNKLAIFHGQKRRSETLASEQRLILLRLIALSCLIPLVIFETSLGVSGSNSSCYPSFAVRAINVIFTVASRAVDVSINNPHYSVGNIRADELLIFFKLAIQDAYDVYKIIFCDVDSARTKNFPSDFKELHSSLFISFMASHGQIPEVNNSIDNDTLIDFLSQRYEMYRTSVTTFAESKREVNHTRIEKVEEDIRFTKSRMNIARNVFTFLEA
jgi:hypothetical protein